MWHCVVKLDLLALQLMWFNRCTNEKAAASEVFPHKTPRNCTNLFVSFFKNSLIKMPLQVD